MISKKNITTVLIKMKKIQMRWKHNDFNLVWKKKPNEFNIKLFNQRLFQRTPVSEETHKPSKTASKNNIHNHISPFECNIKKT